MKPGLDFFRTQIIHEGNGDSVLEVFQRHESHHPKNHQVNNLGRGLLRLRLSSNCSSQGVPGIYTVFLGHVTKENIIFWTCFSTIYDRIFVYPLNHVSPQM